MCPRRQRRARRQAERQHRNWRTRGGPITGTDGPLHCETHPRAVPSRWRATAPYPIDRPRTCSTLRGWGSLSHGCQRADGIIPFGMIPWCSVGKRCSVGRQFSSPHPGRTTREGTMENSRTQSRRELLKHASVGAATVGAAWVVPQIHSSASAQSPNRSNLCTPTRVNLLGAPSERQRRRHDIAEAVLGTAITFTPEHRLRGSGLTLDRVVSNRPSAPSPRDSSRCA
jgi:hypothetical protein